MILKAIRKQFSSKLLNKILLLKRSIETVFRMVQVMGALSHTHAWTHDEHDAIITRCTHRQAESAAHRHARSLLPRIICLRREFHKSGAQARGRTAEQDALSLTCMHHNSMHYTLHPNDSTTPYAQSFTRGHVPVSAGTGFRTRAPKLARAHTHRRTQTCLPLSCTTSDERSRRPALMSCNALQHAAILNPKPKTRRHLRP